MAETYRHPEAIVTGDWLQANLATPGLRIYDCTTYLHYQEGTGRPYTVEPGRADYDRAHIPGAMYLDLQGDFSTRDAPTNFMRLSPDETVAAFARHGVSDDSRVILYARANPNWATRFWWMLRWIGFDNAAILDGGMDKWEQDARPVSTDPASYPAGTLTAQTRPGLFVGKEQMRTAIGDGAICTLNALAPDLHSGANPRYGRPGRIPGSKNVPAAALFDPKTRELVDAGTAARAFAAAGAAPDRPVLNYCGGGIAATLDAFLQHQLGFTDIAVYDASMSEWARDESLPIETD